MIQPRDSKGRFSKMLHNLKQYLNETPHEVERDWAEVKILGLKGPSAKEFTNSFKVHLYKETAQGKIDLGICSLQQAKQIAKEDGGTYIFSSIN